MNPLHRNARLFRNGRSQAVRIPKEFEMSGEEVTIHQEGNKLVLEPVAKGGLLSVLDNLEPLHETFPDIDSSLLPLDDLSL